MVDELEPGAYVTPSVRLVRPLAEGGMGKVWVAEHLVLHTEVVVKLMSKGLDSLEGASARFAREAAASAAVKSPHVVQVFDSGFTEEGIAYIVMELLEGHDLGVQLSSRGRLSPHAAAMIIKQLAKALAKAHRVGVVHRDIKPDNVFLCDVEGGEPFVKLLDFGTAKDESRAAFATTAGQLLGTPYYMSPEQILGEEVDYRTDIWSLGVLAFEALTGARAFDGATVGAITLAIHTTKPRMTDVAPELPAALDDWFARACARDPADRFQSAKAAGDAFTRAISGEAPPESLLPDSDPVLSLTPSIPPPGASPSTSTSMPSVGREHTPSERVATSLSSTLSSPRAERRTMTWIAGGVGLATVAAMFALLTQDDTRSASSGTANAANAAMADPPSPMPTMSALHASNHATPAASTASAASTAHAAAAPTSTSTSTTSTTSGSGASASATPAPFATSPFPSAATDRATDRAKDVAPPRLPAPSTSASSPPPLPRATASAARPAPTVAPTAAPSDTAPAPATPPPAADPLPTAPLDLHDLLPPATPSQ